MQQRDTVKQTLIVATILCVVCSFFVSTAAVVLRPLQEKQKLLEKQRNVLLAAGLLEEGEAAPEEKVKSLFGRVETILVDIASGEYRAVQTDAETQPSAEDELTKLAQAGSYDPRKAAANKEESIEIENDIAGIRRREKYAYVYLVRDDAGALLTVVLPVRGYGLWSTMYGFLALESDLRTIQGLTFYEQQETPGLGGEVANPLWKNKWKTGKMAFDAAGKVQIEVIKGTAPADSPYQVDGITGATFTCRGVTNALHYWLGSDAFGPFLKKLKPER